MIVSPQKRNFILKTTILSFCFCLFLVCFGCLFEIESHFAVLAGLELVNGDQAGL